MTQKCGSCQQELPLEAFGKGRRGQLGTPCRECRRAYDRAWRAKTKNRPSRVAERRASVARSWAAYERHKARAHAIYGGICVACGSSELLEFDHVNGDGREHRRYETGMAMVRRISHLGHRLTDYEMQLLCRACHREKTTEERRQVATAAIPAPRSAANPRGDGADLDSPMRADVRARVYEEA